MTQITRREFIASVSTGAAMFMISPKTMIGKAPRECNPPLPTPSLQQLQWQDMELGMFFHFDIPIYKPDWKWLSWQDLPDPNLYQPNKLDTNQWMELCARKYLNPE